MLALSTDGKKLYLRDAGAWQEFSPQPELVGSGGLLLTTTQGDIIIYDGGGALYAETTTELGLFAPVLTGSSPIASIAMDATHIVVADPCYSLLSGRFQVYGLSGENTWSLIRTVVPPSSASAWTNLGRTVAGSDDGYGVEYYNGHIYVGSCDANEAGGHPRLYRWDGGIVWADVSAGALGSSSVVCGLIQFDSKLFIATGWKDGCHVYYYDGVSTVDCGVPDAGSFPYGMAVHDGNLYIGCYTGTVYRWDGGTAWTSIGSTGLTELISLASHDGALYASGTQTDTGVGNVRHWNGGTSWSKAGALSVPITDNVFPLLSFNGSLYAGGDGSVWKYAGWPATTWSSFDTGQTYIGWMLPYQGKIAVGTGDQGYVGLYDGDATWTSLGQLASSWIDGMGTDGIYLYAVCWSSGEVYRTRGTSPHQHFGDSMAHDNGTIAVSLVTDAGFPGDTGKVYVYTDYGATLPPQEIEDTICSRGRLFLVGDRLLVTTTAGSVNPGLRVYDRVGGGAFSLTTTKTDSWYPYTKGYDGTRIITVLADSSVEVRPQSDWSLEYTVTPLPGYVNYGAAILDTVLAVLEGQASVHTARKLRIFEYSGSWSEVATLDITGSYQFDTADIKISTGLITVASKSYTGYEGSYHGLRIQTFRKDGSWSAGPVVINYTGETVHRAEQYVALSGERMACMLVDHSSNGWPNYGRGDYSVNWVTEQISFDGDLFFCASNSASGGLVRRYAGGGPDNPIWTDLGKPEVDSSGVYAVCEFEGGLYVGALNGSGGVYEGHVYLWAGGTSWTHCGHPASLDHITCLCPWDGDLYAGTQHYTHVVDAEVCRYDGGTSWTNCGHPFGDEIADLCVCGGFLYGAFNDTPGYNKVCRYDGGTSWTDCGQPVPGTAEFPWIYCLYEFNGNLYAGGMDGHVYVYAGGTTWNDCGLVGYHTIVSDLIAWNGQLYASGYDGAKGVYRWEGGTTWTSMAFTNHTMCLGVHDDFLWYGSGYTSGYNWRFDGYRAPHIYAFDLAFSNAGFWHYAPGTETWSLKEFTDYCLVADGSTVYRGHAIAANDVFAAEYKPGKTEAELLHYDGASWSVFADLTSQFPVNQAQIWGVWASSSADIWVTGRDRVLHWNGESWFDHSTAIIVATGATDTCYFSDVWGASVDSVYVVCETYTDEWITIVTRWNGSSWEIVGDPILNWGASWGGIFGNSDNDIWMYSYPDDSAVLYHWDSIAWEERLTCDSSEGAPHNQVCKNLGGLPSGYTCLAFNSEAIDFHESEDGSSWASAIWPDSNLIDAVATYAMAPTVAPHIDNISPPDESTNVPLTSHVSFDVHGGSYTVDLSTAIVSISGIVAYDGTQESPEQNGHTVAISAISGGYHFDVVGPTPFSPSTEYVVDVQAEAN